MIALSDAFRALFDGPNTPTSPRCCPTAGPTASRCGSGRAGGPPHAFLTDPASRKARNLAHDPRVAISVTDHDRPYAMAQVRGRVAARLEGEAAWAIIDRIAHKYTGQLYPLRTDRVVFLVDPEHAWVHTFA